MDPLERKVQALLADGKVKEAIAEVKDHMRYDRMDAQLDANANPYATPINIPSNMKGCLGIWAGFTPWYDTLICLD